MGLDITRLGPGNSWVLFLDSDSARLLVSLDMDQGLGIFQNLDRTQLLTGQIWVVSIWEFIYCIYINFHFFKL